MECGDFVRRVRLQRNGGVKTEEKMEKEERRRERLCAKRMEKFLTFLHPLMRKSNLFMISSKGVVVCGVSSPQYYKTKCREVSLFNSTGNLLFKINFDSVKVRGSRNGIHITSPEEGWHLTITGIPSNWYSGSERASLEERFEFLSRNGYFPDRELETSTLIVDDFGKVVDSVPYDGSLLRRSSGKVRRGGNRSI